MRIKGFSTLSVVILSLLIFLIIGIALKDSIIQKTPFLSKTTKKTSKDSVSPVPDYVSQRKYNFTLDSLSVGDKFGELEVVAIEPYNADYGPLAEDNLKITFSGDLIIKGRYINDIKGGPMGGKIYFDPSKEAIDNTVPRLESDKKDGLYIIFSNQEYARQLLDGEGSSGEVTIKAESLVLIYYPSEFLHSFKLIDIAE